MADYSGFAAIANENTATQLFDKVEGYRSFAWELLTHQRMSAAKIKTPVLGKATPATWVGANHRKQYVKYTVGAKYLIADEIAQVTAVAEEDFMDNDLDIVSHMEQLGGEAILRGLDLTIAGSVDLPAAWPSDVKAIVPGAISVGNVADSTGNLSKDVTLAASLLRKNGFRADVFVIVGGPDEFWGVTDGDIPVGVLTGDSPETYRVHGKRVVFVDEDVFPEGVRVVALDTRHLVLGVREDIQFKNTDQGTAIAQASGANGTLTPADVISAFQDDAVLFRVMARFGFNHSGDATHYPAAVVNFVVEEDEEEEEEPTNP